MIECWGILQLNYVFVSYLGANIALISFSFSFLQKKVLTSLSSKAIHNTFYLQWNAINTTTSEPQKVGHIDGMVGLILFSDKKLTA